VSFATITLCVASERVFVVVVVVVYFVIDSVRKLLDTPSYTRAQFNKRINEKLKPSEMWQSSSSWEIE
jgi:uncharacterized protein HemY